MSKPSPPLRVLLAYAPPRATAEDPTDLVVHPGAPLFESSGTRRVATITERIPTTLFEAVR